MKSLYTILFWALPFFAIGQECNCASDSALTEQLSCEPIRFDNNTSLYWNLNCDSAWMTFETAVHKKEVIFSLGGELQNLVGRLGYSFAQEYKNSFLLQNEVISGCCDPAEFHLFNKSTGKMQANLGRILFYSEQKGLPFIISLTNNSYDTLIGDYNTLAVHDIDRDKKYFVTLPKGELETAMSKMNVLFAEHLFESPEINGSMVILRYRTQIVDGKAQLNRVVIDLNKYKRN